MTRPRLAALTAVLAGACTLAACSNNAGSGGPAAEQATAPVVTTSVPAPTKNVEAVTWNLATGEPATLDPAMAGVESISTVVANMCEGLFTLGPDYRLQPALATGFTHPDPLTYVISLREGVTFWDGKPVTAEDVLYSVKRILDPELGSSWIGWAVNLDTIEATGGNEITVKLKKPDVMIPNFFAMPAFYVVQKDFTEAAGRDFGTAKSGVMCTGPYTYGSWTQGQDVKLTRNDAWWNTEVKPKIKDLRFTFVADPSAQTAALASGDVDGQFIVPRAAHEQLAAKGNMLFGTSLSPTFLAVLNPDGALSDPATRQALQALIDYKGIIGSVYQGTAQPLRALVPPAAWGYGKEVFQAEYDKLPEPVQDLEKAKTLVGQSAKAKEKIVLAYTTASEEETRIATAIADAATQVGMDIELKPLTGEQFGAIFAAPQARAGLDLFLVTGYLDFPEPLSYYQFFTSSSFYNFPGYKNKDYDTAVFTAMVTEDPAARAREVAKAQALMAKDLVNIPIATQYVNVYYGPELTGLVPRQSYLVTPWATTLGGE
ncbi:ABC transporter substrate-binding protein [Planobispora longispora]|uniref:ABC transporter substrate-binding protein n=1 Tax=Planobispora longispora TaxID=28887 RepID=A0A8J3WAS4_9ACTN|nr:ABC transporter substrate-binding protein [Planobispora longispora]BFE78360.1 ABC transporter substrate-binding protein [Planobispora longispora]GIH81106.1 ABC transporter substrate-binding protein [Planobispora longispora]